MDEFTPTTTARDEIQQRIDVLKTRIAGHDADEIREAEQELKRRQRVRSQDAERLGQWLTIAATLDRANDLMPIDTSVSTA